MRVEKYRMIWERNAVNGASVRSSWLNFSSGFIVSVVSGVWSVGALEVSTGKVSSIEAMNGSTVLLPCTYSSCIGIKNLYFRWHYDDNGTMMKVQTASRHKDRLCEHAVCSVFCLSSGGTQSGYRAFHLALCPNSEMHKYWI